MPFTRRYSLTSAEKTCADAICRVASDFRTWPRALQTALLRDRRAVSETARRGVAREPRHNPRAGVSPSATAAQRTIGSRRGAKGLSSCRSQNQRDPPRLGRHPGPCAASAQPGSARMVSPLALSYNRERSLSECLSPAAVSGHCAGRRRDNHGQAPRGRQGRKDESIRRATGRVPRVPRMPARQLRCEES